MRTNYLIKLTITAAFAAVCLSLVPVHTAQAAQICSGPYGSSSNPVNGKCPDGQTLMDDGRAGLFTNGSTKPDNGPGCGIGSGLNFSICITNIVYLFTVGIGSVFAYVAAFFFDLAIQLSLQSTAYALDFLSTGWTLARDLANMSFIFILIYIGVSIILGAQNNSTAKLLVGVIVVALFVNFSFFFSRVVIDAGNLLSVQFYNAIPDSGSIGATAANSSVTTASNFSIGGIGPSWLTSLASGGQMKDLTGSIMQMLSFQNLFSTAGFTKYVESNNAGFMSGLISLTFLYIAAGALFWGLIVMFVAAGVKFLMRIVILWFLIIASPLAFIAYAIPRDNIQKLFSQWLSMLVNHAFYPAGFMFVFFILTLFSKQLTKGDGSGGLVDSIFNPLATAGGPQGADFLPLMAMAIANVAIRMGFVLGVMYVGLKASEFIGVSAGKMADNFGRRVGGWFANPLISGAKFGAAWVPGAAYRESVGRGAGAISNRLQNSRWANQDNFFGRLGYRLRNRVAEPIANSSLTDAAGSRRALEATTRRRQEDMRGNLRNINRQDRDRENEAAVGRVVGRGTQPPQNAQDNADESRIRRLNARELTALSADQLANIAHVLTAAQMQGIERDDNRTEQDRDRISQVWNRRGTRANPHNGQFGADDAAINRADRLVEAINDLQTNMGRIANNIAAGQRLTGQTIRQAISDIHGQVLDPANARHDRLQAEMRQRFADLSAVQAAGNAVLVAQYQNDIQNLENTATQALTEIRNGNALVQQYTELNTARGNLEPAQDHHTPQPGRNAPNRGEFDAR